MVLEWIFRVFQGSFHVIGTTAAFKKMHQITKFEECNCERIFYVAVFKPSVTFYPSAFTTT